MISPQIEFEELQRMTGRRHDRQMSKAMLSLHKKKILSIPYHNSEGAMMGINTQAPLYAFLMYGTPRTIPERYESAILRSITSLGERMY